MNYRSQVASILFCLFMWPIGAHWLYLGRWRWGFMYLGVMLGAWPVSLVFVIICHHSAAIGGLLLIFAWGLTTIVGLASLYDFFCLLMIHPREFDRQFNS